MLAKVACPRCRKVMKSNQAVSAGTEVTCRGCGAPFTVREADILPTGATPPPRNGLPATAPARPASKSAVLVAAPFAPPPAATRPAPAAPSPPVAAGAAPPPAKGPNRTLVLGGVVAGALLFVGTGVVLAVVCLSGGDAIPTVAQNDPFAGSPSGEALPAKLKEAPAVPPQQSPAEKALGKPLPLDKAEAPAPADRREDVKPAVRPGKIRPAAGDAPPPELAVPGGKGALTALPPDLQKRVNAAIDRGVKHLRNSQRAGGSWEGGAYQLGYTALPGLTLLECGVPAADPAVQKAARLVRVEARDASLRHTTYQLSLAILFLDRLGDPADRPLIQSLALRLIAGQTSAGGWNYNCPLLSGAEEKQLFAFLKANRPTPLSDPITEGKHKSLSDPLAKTKPVTLPEGITEPKGQRPVSPGEQTKLADPANPPAAEPKPAPSDPGEKPAVPPKAKKPAPAPKLGPMRPDFLPANLRKMPVAQKLPKGKGKMRLLPGRDDNSNTQFAIMALWAARRHGVPMERTLALVEERFRVSQHGTGAWGYLFVGPQDKDAMTCVGLIGLAVGHGSENDLRGGGKAPNIKPGAGKAKDEAILRGLRALGKFLDHPGTKRAQGKASAYFLWSVERVGVLYNLKTIGNKDWYRWGVDLLLPAQKANGSWFMSGYPGSTTPLDTSMALLFLKRANLTRDLTENLQLYMPITDPDASPRGSGSR